MAATKSTAKTKASTKKATKPAPKKTAAKKAPAKKAAPKKTVAPKVKATAPAFQNLIILSDFNCGIANAQIEMRFRNVFQWVLEESATRSLMPKEVDLPTRTVGTFPQAPSVIDINDTPFGNIDYGAYSLYCCYRALGRSRPNIFIHVTDPGVGQGDDRTIMVTDYGNTFIGPDNNSLGLLKAYFEERGITCKLWKIDRDKVEELEQHRMEEPTYHIPRTFHGRDIFAVTAGLIAGGVHPSQLAKEEVKGGPQQSLYAKDIKPIPQQLRQRVVGYAFRDNTYGNLKTNLTLDSLSFDQLVDEGAQFRVSTTEAETSWWQPSGRVVTFTAKRIFADVPKNESLLYLGSTFAPQWDERFVELAINMNSASDRLGISHNYVGAKELIVERIY